MELGDKQKRKLMAAAEVVEKGDFAVLEKILEFQDFLDENNVKLNEFFDNIKAEILEYKENTSSEMSREMEEKEDELEKIASDVIARCAEMEKTMDKMHSEMTYEVKKEISTLKTKLNDTVDEIDKVRKEIPTLPPEVDLTDIYNSLKTLESKIEGLDGGGIIEKINSSEEQIDKERIKGLEEEINKLRDDIKSVSAKGGVRRVFQPYVDDFSGSTDGVTKTFYLSREPLRTNTIQVFGSDFPIILRPTIDFTVNGKTLTLTSAVQAPSSGATLIIHYFA